MRKTILMIMLGGALCLCPAADAQGFLKKAGEKIKKAKETVNQAKETVNSVKNILPGGKATKGSNRMEELPEDIDDNLYEEDEENNASYSLPLHPELHEGNLYDSYSGDSKNKQFLPRTSSETVSLPVKKRSLYYSDFSDGVALIAEYGSAPYFINTGGNKLNIQFDLTALGDDREAYPKFYNGRTIINRDGAWHIVDKQGNIVKTLPGKVAKAAGFVDGVGIVITKQDASSTQVKYIDTNGNNIYPLLGFAEKHAPGFKLGAMFRPTSNGLTAVMKHNQGDQIEKWGFRDEKGNLKIPAKYYKVKDFHSGLAAVQEVRSTGVSGGNWGFVDKNGNVVIDFKYRDVSDFNGDYALVRTGYSNWDMINKRGEVVGNVVNSEDFIPIFDGYALCSAIEDGQTVQYLVHGPEKRKVAYSTRGQIYNAVYDPVDGKVYQDKDNYNPFGWLEIPSMNTKIMNLTGFFRNGIAKAVDGYVNEDGVYIIKFKYED